MENYYNKIGAHSQVEQPAKTKEVNLLDIDAIKGTGTVDLFGMSPLPSPSGFNEKVQYIKPIVETKPSQNIQFNEQSGSINDLNSLFDNVQIAKPEQSFEAEPTPLERITQKYRQSFGTEKQEPEKKPKIETLLGKPNVFDFTPNYSLSHDHHKSFLGELKNDHLNRKKDIFNAFEFPDKASPTKNRLIDLGGTQNNENKENAKNINNVSYPAFADFEFKTEKKSFSTTEMPKVQEKKDFFDIFN